MTCLGSRPFVFFEEEVPSCNAFSMRRHIQPCGAMDADKPAPMLQVQLHSNTSPSRHGLDFGCVLSQLQACEHADHASRRRGALHCAHCLPANGTSARKLLLRVRDLIAFSKFACLKMADLLEMLPLLFKLVDFGACFTVFFLTVELTASTLGKQTTI